MKIIRIRFLIILVATIPFYTGASEDIPSVKLDADNKLESKEQALKPIYVVGPKYPRWAQKWGIEGYVIVEYTINKKGKTTDHIVIEAKCGDLVSESNPLRFKYDSSDCELFNSDAIAAARQSRYKPITIDGDAAIKEQVRWRYRFEMDDGEFIPILDIPQTQILIIEDGLRKAKSPSGRYIKVAEALALGNVEEFPDANFYLGKIYSFMKKDDLAIKHFKNFLEFKIENKEMNQDIWNLQKQRRAIYEASALALLTEKLYQKNRYKEIIEFADIIKSQQIFIINNSDFQDSATLIEFSNFYLGTSYLFEGYINEGKEPLLWVKESTNNDALISLINDYLSQINNVTQND